MKIQNLFLSAIVSLLLAWPTYASMGQFVGTWVNVNSNTKGITKIVIQKIGNKMRIQTWGQCHPTDCNWGKRLSIPYAKNVSQNLVNNTIALTAMYKPGFANKLLVIKRAGTRLHVQSFTQFTDNSGRSNYSQVYRFKKLRRIIPIPLPIIPR